MAASHTVGAARSSKAGEHAITLPKNSELLKIATKGKELDSKLINGVVSFPVTPGDQKVDVEFRLNQGLSTFYRTPSINLGIPSVNKPELYDS